MPNRHAYIGDPSSGTSIPLQAEASAYMAAAGISAADFAETINRFFYMTKRDGTKWDGTHVTDLYLFATDTVAQSKTNLVPGARTAGRLATISGSPAFAARKGYNFSGGGNFSLPFQSGATSLHGLAGDLNPAAGAGTVVVGAAGATVTNYNTFAIGNQLGSPTGWKPGPASAAQAAISGRGIMIANAALSAITPGGALYYSGASANPGVDAPIVGQSPTNVTLLSAYVVLAAIPPLGLRKFAGRLQSLLDDLGAFD